MIGSFSRSWFKTSSSKTWNAKYFHHTVVCTWDCLLNNYKTEIFHFSHGVSSVHMYTVLSVRVSFCERRKERKWRLVESHTWQNKINSCNIDVSTRWMKTTPITAHQSLKVLMTKSGPQDIWNQTYRYLINRENNKRMNGSIHMRLIRWKRSLIIIESLTSVL